MLIWPILGFADLGWLLPTVGSILYIAIGIFCLKRENLREEYNLNMLPLILFILFGTVLGIERTEKTAYDVIFRVLEWAIAGVILLRIITKEISLPPIKSADIKWTAIGAIVGTLLALCIVFFYVSFWGFSAPRADTRPYAVFMSIWNLILTHGKAVILEEIIFRGLLFGYLAKQGGNEKKAFVIQFMLSWGLHFFYLWSSSLGFWFSVPLSLFIVSMVFWWSRSLSSSFMAHLFYNIFLTIFFILLGN